MQNLFVSISTNNKGIIYNKSNVTSIIVTQKKILVNFINNTNQELELLKSDGEANIQNICSQLITEMSEKTVDSPLEKYLIKERAEMEKHLLNSKEKVKELTLEKLEEMSEENHNIIDYKLNNGLLFFIEGIEIRDLLSEINTRKAFPHEDII